MAPASVPRSYTDLAALQGISELGRTDRGAALEQIGRQFESLFVSQLLKGMRAANELLNQDGPFSGWEMQFRQEMLDQQLSLSVAQGRGFGLAALISSQIAAQLPERSAAEPARAAPASVLDARLRGLEDGPTARARVKSPIAAAAAQQIQHDERSNATASSGGKSEPARFDSPREFLKALEPLARRAAERLGLDEAVLLAQSALETGWGAKITGGAGGSSRNLFNIKAGTDWSGPQVTVPTLEYRDGVAVRERHSFRVYESFADSFEDFVDFLTSRPRYQQALENVASPESFLRGLQDAGYATDPDYADKILNVLDRVASYLQER